MDYVSKPKGMHWKTFNRLMADMDYYDNTSTHMVAEKFGMFERL